MRTSSAVISCLLLLLALTQAHSVSATQSSNDDAAADAEKALLLNVIGPALAGTSNLTNVACMFSWTESNDLCNTNIFANPVGVCSSANCFKGITCTLVFLTWRVSAIYLGNCDLAGSLPPQLNQLPYLMSLSIYGSTSLKSTLPLQWSNMTALHVLSIKQCGIYGSLPVVWREMKLKQLELDGNELLHGPVPIEWGSEGAMAQLTLLTLSSCDLLGPLPRWPASLTAIDLTNNRRLGGALPSTLGRAAGMRTLLLSGCNFLGSIPSDWSTMTKLQEFSLADNPLFEVSALALAPARGAARFARKHSVLTSVRGMKVSECAKCVLHLPLPN
jgi:hypothetical protein